MEYSTELPLESTWPKLGPLWKPCGEYFQSNFTPKSMEKAFAQVCTGLKFEGGTAESAAKYVSPQAPAAGAAEAGTL